MRRLLLVAVAAWALPARAADAPVPAVPARLPAVPPLLANAKPGDDRQASAAPQAAKPFTPIQLTAVQAANLLLKTGRVEEAKTALRIEMEAKPDDYESLFLLGMIAVEQKDYDAAIDLFRRILVARPDAERVRLELARAFYLKGDFDNAIQQFRRARAGDVPDPVKNNIDQFLVDMSRKREWTFSFQVALAPDTNLNAATSVNQVNLYGLPFTLDPSARQHSGVGLYGEAGVEYSPLITDWLKARVGADAYRTEYGGGAFDDMTASVYAGPQLLLGNWSISALGTGFDRWYGNRPYVNGAGGRLAVDYGIASGWQVGSVLGLQDIRYRGSPYMSGPLFSTSLSVGHAFSPSSAAQLQAGFNRQDAGLPGFSYSGLWVGAGYQRDLPLGFSIGLQPSFWQTVYDAPLAAFGHARHDQTVMLRLDILNRRFSYHGFTPKLGYTFTDQRSNIPLYSYTRSQFQIGITSQF